MDTAYIKKCCKGCLFFFVAWKGGGLTSSPHIHLDAENVVAPATLSFTFGLAVFIYVMVG